MSQSKEAVGPEADPAEDTPKELAEALEARPAVKARYEGLPPSHRREYARFVVDAIKPETRRRRAEKAVEMISGMEKAR